MDLELTDADIAFRDELREFLDQNAHLASDWEQWHRALVEHRWAVPNWPAEWGGRDATITQQLIFAEETGTRGVPGPRNTIALYNIGPMLMQHGTREQQERYLPAMVTADEIWCQGFSEPGAGSDLAALRTRAEDRGDHWLVNGQKTWNTFGNEADLCLALCRTDPDAPKHQGISALIIDMHHPGVEVRPLREITGDAGFNEIFFTDVEVDKEQVVGPVDAGWKVAMSTLSFERIGTVKLGYQLQNRLDALIELARDLGRDQDPVIRQKTAALAVQVDLMQILAEQVIEAMQRDVDPGALLPLGKLQWSYLMQDLAELGLEIQGPHSQLWKGSPHQVDDGQWQQNTVYSRMTTIGAGTTEVQKNIMAYRVLGLPRHADSDPKPAVSRDRPLDDEHAALRETVRRFLAEQCPTTYVRDRYEHDHGTTEDVWQGLASMGVLGTLVPEEHGGLGMGYAELGIVLEEAGRALLPGPFDATALGAVASIRELADPDDQAVLLPGIADGSTRATLALLEPDSGHDWRHVSVKAVLSDDHWRLSGTKLFVPDGLDADLLLTTAVADGELGLFAVRADDVAQITPLTTIDGTRKQAEVVLRDTPARRLGSGDTTDALHHVLDLVRCGIVADAVGCADRALDLATEYAKVRVQFDQPIGSFQAIQHKLADMLRHVELARGGVVHAFQAADRDDRDGLHRLATMVKAFASDALYRVGAETIQVFGGVGFTWEHDAHLYYKRLLSAQHALGGTPEHQEEYARLLFAS